MLAKEIVDINSTANGRNVQAGIVSSGIGCARPNSPGTYTRVNHPDISNFIAEASDYQAKLHCDYYQYVDEETREFIYTLGNSELSVELSPEYVTCLNNLQCQLTPECLQSHQWDGEFLESSEASLCKFNETPEAHLHLFLKGLSSFH